jgi:hypothetical protein
MAIIWNEAFKQIKVLTPPDNPAIFGFFIEGTKIPETTIIYNDSLVASFDVGTATLPVKDLKMKTDIVITVPKAEGGTDSAIPIEVATEAEMTALLTSGEVGGVYKYVGATGTYENGALYVLEAELGSFTYAQTSSWYSQFVVRQFLIGMTWAEFIASEYNAIQADKNDAGTFGVKGQFINQNGYVMFSGTDLNSANPLTIPVFNNSYSSVAITDVIYGGTYMSVNNSGGGSGN